MAGRGKKGYLCMVLHAHLPYVRHPECPFFLEENWLYEAMTETYIPLLDLLSRLVDGGIDFRLTLSLSPSLAEMLNDDLLMQRYVTYMERLIELAEAERRRTRRSVRFAPVIQMYLNRFRRIRYLFETVYRKRLIPVFSAVQQTGHLEIIPSAATHAYLPHLSLFPQAVKAQIRIGLQQYGDNFGQRPHGIWLPECGFLPGFDAYVREEGVTFFFLESHGITRGSPSPRFGTYLPVFCPSRTVAFGRNADVSRQVWSSFGGYPGDRDYRDFYRDAGFEVDEDHVRVFLEPYCAKTYTGLKYFRITGNTDRKKPYAAERARLKAREHARHFIESREDQMTRLHSDNRIRPVVTAAYDAELFGHWWFEGIQWLEELFREMNCRCRNFALITPSEYLRMPAPRMQVSEPSASSWGKRGYHDVWLNDCNDYIYRHLLKATERMIDLADRFADAEGMLRRALNQAARELLLCQHSDWTFMMGNNTSADYARRRFTTHISRFTHLYEAILSGSVQERLLTELEDRDRIFQTIDYRVYRDGGRSSVSRLSEVSPYPSNLS